MANILLADDAPDLLFLFFNALKMAGHHVRIAANGREAVDAFYPGDFDLAILDVAMPELNGFEAATAIRALSPRQPIAFLTAFDEPLTVGRAGGFEAAVIWSKPIDIADLCARVDALLESVTDEKEGVQQQ